MMREMREELVGEGMMIRPSGSPVSPDRRIWETSVQVVVRPILAKRGRMEVDWLRGDGGGRGVGMKAVLVL